MTASSAITGPTPRTARQARGRSGRRPVRRSGWNFIYVLSLGLRLRGSGTSSVPVAHICARSGQVRPCGDRGGGLDRRRQELTGTWKLACCWASGALMGHLPAWWGGPPGRGARLAHARGRYRADSPIVHFEGGRSGTRCGCVPTPKGRATEATMAGAMAPAHWAARAQIDRRRSGPGLVRGHPQRDGGRPRPGAGATPPSLQGQARRFVNGPSARCS